MYKILINKKALKGMQKMPLKINEKMNVLLKDLRDKGPIRKEWSNFSDLGNNLYHCHLTYKWIACWKHEKNSIVIEVYYAGSREDAPY
jgi:mRNA-degrading endonuclease RelE of RelBE toxin-antitoxin system